MSICVLSRVIIVNFFDTISPPLHQPISETVLCNIIIVDIGATRVAQSSTCGFLSPKDGYEYIMVYGVI